LERLVRFVTTTSPRAHCVAAIVIIATTAALCIATWMRGCSPVLQYVGDYVVQLDGGWRVLQGQVPHRDFYSAPGPIYSWETALGMAISPTVNCLAYSHAVLLPLAVLVATVVTWRRLPPFWSALFVLYMAVMIVAPNVWGTPWELPVHAITYNRWGYFLLSVLLMDLFLAPGRSFTGWFAGTTLVLLLLLKLNYFGIAVLSVVLAFWLGKRDRKWLLACGASALVALVAAGWALDGFGHFAADMRRMSGTQSLIGRLEELHTDIRSNRYRLMACILFAWLAAPLVTHMVRPLKRFWYMVGVGLLITATNAEQIGMPMIGVAAILLLGGARGEARRHVATAALGLALVGTVLLPDALALGRSFASGAWPGRIETDSMRDMPLGPERLVANKAAYERILARPRDHWKPWRSDDYGQWANDGIELLRPHVRADSRVSTLDFANPFPFALGLPPPRGDALCWHLGRNFTAEVHLPAERAFGDTTLLMVPTVPYTPSEFALMRELFGDYLDAHFAEVARSPLWTLYGRKPSAGG
jgi:hypothetical protein